MWKQTLGAVLVGSVILGISGCSKQEFVKQQFTADASAVGSRYLPAKVDIVMVPDNTASLNAVFTTVQPTLSSFVNSLQGQQWDYHVGRVSIYNPSNITQVLVNPQTNVATLPDGTPNPGIGGIVPSDRAITDPNAFPLLETVYATGNGDYTYSNLINKLQAAQADTYTNFLRPDALLAIVVITNGYEVEVQSDPYNSSTLSQNALQNFAAQLTSLKGSSRLIRFYPVAAYGYHANGCLTSNGTAFQGLSYLNMAQYFQSLPQYDGGGNPTMDFCSFSSLSNVLNDIAANLTNFKQDYVYSNIVIGDQPVVDSIHVYKNGSEISRNATNGWSYPCASCDSTGYGSVYTVTGIYDETSNTITPISLNRQSGYVIQLNGSGRMIGNDTPNLSYEKQ
jgi:hypothetical protein